MPCTLGYIANYTWLYSQQLYNSSWFLTQYFFLIYRPTLSFPFVHCSISWQQAARYIKERKYFTTEISLFRPLLLQPFLPCVHSQKVFTVVLMRICNFHRKKGLCSWCIRPLYIFLTVLAGNVTFSCAADQQPESIFLILSPAAKTLFLRLFPPLLAWFPSNRGWMISFLSTRNDKFSLHLITHRLVPLINI